MTKRKRMERDPDAELLAVGVVRVSTEQQVESGLGLEAQEAQIRGAVIGKGGRLVGLFEDPAVSGALPAFEREGIAQAMDMIRSGAANTLVVAKLDRLGRNAIDVLMVADVAEREGWSLMILDLGLDTTTPVGRFALTVLAAVAELERNLIRQRTRDALAVLRARGVVLGAPPILEPAVVAMVRGMPGSLRGVAAQLNSMGVPAAKGGRWSASSVRWVRSGRMAG